MLKVLETSRTRGASFGGKGHEFTSVKIHSKIKITGRRGGEKGQDFPSSVETLGNILNSGPRWGVKVDTVTICENLWDLKNSVPSHGEEGQ